MSSMKRKQGKPTKSLHIKNTGGPSPRLKGPKTRNRSRRSDQLQLEKVQPEPQTRKSQRVPKKKVPFSNEIPLPKKRVKKKEDDPPALSLGPSTSTIFVSRPEMPKRRAGVTVPRLDIKEDILDEDEAEKSAENPAASDSESDSSEIKTDSDFETVQLSLEGTLGSLQTMEDPTINVELPYLVIKKKKKKAKKKRKRKAEKQKVKSKKMKVVPEKTLKPEMEVKEEMPAEPIPESHDHAAKENILDIDQLRKLSADSLVIKYASRKTVTVPMDKAHTITQSVYTCRMLPSHCFEKFMGIDTDTRQQITRHLLRHVGELLTMANEGMASNEMPDAANNHEEEEAAAFVSTTASKKTTYHVASNPKPFTVSHPQNVNLKRSKYTVIRSSEGKEGTNEVVLLPRSRGYYSNRSNEEDPQTEGITEQSFHQAINSLLGACQEEHEPTAPPTVVDDNPFPVLQVHGASTGGSQMSGSQIGDSQGLSSIGGNTTDGITVTGANSGGPLIQALQASNLIDCNKADWVAMASGGASTSGIQIGSLHMDDSQRCAVISSERADGSVTIDSMNTRGLLQKGSQGDAFVTAGTADGVVTISGKLPSVIFFDEKDIQMDVEVSTGVHRRRSSSIANIPDGVGSIMKLTDALLDPQSGRYQDFENSQEVPFPDHNYSNAEGATLPSDSIHTDSHGAPTEAPSSIEESRPEKLDIGPILNSMNQQVSSLIPDIELQVRAMTGEGSAVLPAAVTLSADLQSMDPVAAALQAAGMSTADPVAAAILAAGVPSGDPTAGASLMSVASTAGMAANSSSATLAGVMSPEEEEMLRLKAVDLLNSLLKNQKRRGPFRCQICQKILTAASTLRAHYRSHAGIKPFQCGLCNATFTRQHSLNYHMMIHNQEARFSCSFCARQFRHANHFREHLRRHTGEEPYGCTDCPARFKTRNTYKRHMRSKHNKIVTNKNTIKLMTDEG